MIRERWVLRIFFEAIQFYLPLAAGVAVFYLGDHWHLVTRVVFGAIAFFVARGILGWSFLLALAGWALLSRRKAHG